MQRAFLLLVMAAATAHSWHRRFLIDDAFISFRYAANLTSGHGLVFNAGERVEGYTNFLWTLLTAGAMSAGLDPASFSWGAGLASSAALLWVVWRWGRDLGLEGLWAILPPAMLAANRSFAVWATGGLETRLFTLLVVAGAWRVGRELTAPPAQAASRFPFSAVLLALACLTRPEGYLAAAVALAVMAWRGPRRHALLAGAVIGVVCGAHEAWRLSYYGDWVPNSFRAKVAGPRLVSGVVYLAVFARHHLLAVALVAAAACAWRRRWPRLPLAGFAVPFAALFVVYTLLVGGDHFEFRFVDVLLPLAFLAAAAAAGGALRAAPPLAAGVVAALLLGGAALSSLTGFAGVDRQVPFAGGSHYVSIVSAETEAAYLAYWERIGDWLRDHAASDESIAVTPAGVIPYLTGLRTLDMLGINDREIARLPARPGRNVGHEKRVEADVARARGITYLVADPVISRGPADRPPRAVEVDFGDFHWYFLPLTDTARIPPGSSWKAGSHP
ncbi:MAG: hypothetical protein ACREAA_03065 [Candidatus Polarisedimenticolia bacterium]